MSQNVLEIDRNRGVFAFVVTVICVTLCGGVTPPGLEPNNRGSNI